MPVPPTQPTNCLAQSFPVTANASDTASRSQPASRNLLSLERGHGAPEIRPAWRGVDRAITAIAGSAISSASVTPSVLS